MIVVYDDDSPTHLLSHHANPKSNQTLLTWRHRYSIVKSLAGAILYLHEEWDEQVIHRNITSSTVILDSDLNPRLSGFALAEFLTRNDHGHKAASRSEKSVRGIFGYVSPEYIESGEATTAADIYSFGVVVLEVVTGESAVDFRRKEVLLVRRVVELERELVDLVDSRLNGEYDYGKMVRLVKLGIACTRSDANLRPTIREIVSILDGNDRLFKEISSERIEEWSRRNTTSLSMIRSMRALGIH